MALKQDSVMVQKKMNNGCCFSEACDKVLKEYRDGNRTV